MSEIYVSFHFLVEEGKKPNSNHLFLAELSNSYSLTSISYRRFSAFFCDENRGCFYRLCLICLVSLSFSAKASEKGSMATLLLQVHLTLLEEILVTRILWLWEVNHWFSCFTRFLNLSIFFFFSFFNVWEIHATSQAMPWPDSRSP